MGPIYWCWRCDDCTSKPAGNGDRWPKAHCNLGLVLETPFVDLRSMLVALYPQKFLPYRYLYPFLRSTWDSSGALQQVAAAKPTRLQKILIMQAGSDEIVPDGQAELLRHVCAEGGLDAELKVIKGALHTEIMAKQEGRKMIAEFLKNISKGKCP